MKVLTIIGIIILVLMVIAAVVIMSMVMLAANAARCENCPQKEQCDKRIAEGRMSICEEEIFGQQNTPGL